MTESAEEFEFEYAADNPDLLASAQDLTTESQAPNLPDPLDGPVSLPAGFRRVKDGSDGNQFEDVRTAWVRELNGEDEEKISRAKLKNDVTAFLSAILEAGVEKLGDSRPTRSDIDSLVVGDQQFLLVEIARATYGDDLHYKNFTCPHCQKKFDVELSLSEDLPVTRLDKVADSSFEVRLKRDRVASVNLPTGEVSTLAANVDTAAEANTTLVAHCVEEIRGPKGTQKILGDMDMARKLGLADRQALVEAMSERMPGPQYNGVRFNHEPGCGEEIRLQVTLADLFLGL